MRKFLAVLLASLVSVCAFASVEQLVSEDAYIRTQEGLCWEFTVPENTEKVVIMCATDAKFTSKMTFAVVDTPGDAKNFCNGGEYSYLKGTYKTKATTYDLTLRDLVPGRTYWFCAWNGALGIFSAKQYKIQASIVAFVHPHAAPLL